MASDKKTYCRYCDSQNTQSDYALHRVSNAHVKKVQKNLIHRGFTCACLVCNFSLKNLKQAELHIQDKSHTDRMKSFLVDSFLCNDKCTCGSCGITFFNEVALEAHRLSPSHDLTTSGLHTPKLDELSRLLSGLHGKQFMSICNHLCSVCDATFDCIENSIMHLFTAAHISRLRSSSCMLCKKEFTHSSDRELHVNSYKHQIVLRKCRNLLEEGRTQALLRKGGYPCMLCMIWCNSWFCFELHLLDKCHAKMSVQSQAKCPISAKIVFSAVLEDIGQSSGCDESTMSNWREWRQDESEEHVWCHRCGVLLLSIDEVNKHLNKHSVDRCLMTSRSHSSKVTDLTSVCEIFDCIVCVVSFKNAFMLSAHEASFEHHRRLAACRSISNVECCSNCGLLIYNEGDSHGAVGGSLAQTNRVEVSPKCLELVQRCSLSCDLAKNTSERRVLDSIMQATSSAEGVCQTSVVADKACIDYVKAHSFLALGNSGNALKVGRALGSGEPPVSLSDKTVRDGKGIDRVFIENGPLMNESLCTLYTCHNDNVSSLSGCSLNPKNGHPCTNIVTDGNGVVAEKTGTIMPSSLAVNQNGIKLKAAHSLGVDPSLSHIAPPNGANSPVVQHQLQLACASLNDPIMQQNPAFLAGQVTDANGTEPANKANIADIAVPIVVAATFAPLGTLQESLQSITAIVAESLTSALPTFYRQQSASPLKRKSQSGVQEETVNRPDVKRSCSETILEAALRRSLQSVGQNATVSKDLDVKCQGLADKEKVRHRIGNDEDIKEPQTVVAVAASIIPNGLQDLSRPTGVQAQGEANKNLGNTAVQSGDDSSKWAEESTELKSESLSQIVAGDEGSAGSTRGKTGVEEKLTQLDLSHMEPRAAFLCPGIPNVIASTPVPLANGAINPIKEEASLPAKQLTTPMAVVKSGASEESKSNDDDDDDDAYAFLDPTKGQVKWWTSSDSEDDSLGAA